jgi:hypothetical protein
MLMTVDRSIGLFDPFLAVEIDAGFRPEQRNRSSEFIRKKRMAGGHVDRYRSFQAEQSGFAVDQDQLGVEHVEGR